MNNLKKSLLGWAVLFAAFSFLIISCGKEEGDEAKPTPVVSALNPSSGYVGDAVTITGKNFGTDKAKVTVLFGGNANAELASVTDTEIKTSVPTGATTGRVTVKVEERAGVSTSDFVVLQAPEVSEFTPARAQEGEEVTITGKNFGTDKSNVRVLFADNIEATVSTLTDTEIKVTVPAAAVSGNIKVLVNKKEAISSEAFSVVVRSYVLNGFKEENYNTSGTTILQINSSHGYSFSSSEDGYLSHIGMRLKKPAKYKVFLWRESDKALLASEVIDVTQGGIFMYTKLKTEVEIKKDEKYRIVLLYEGGSLAEISYIKYPIERGNVTIHQVVVGNDGNAYPDVSYVNNSMIGVIDFRIGYKK